MVSPQVSLLDSLLKLAFRALIGDKKIVSVPRHDGWLVDMVNESNKEDLNTTCDEDSNTTCDEDSNTT